MLNILKNKRLLAGLLSLCLAQTALATELSENNKVMPQLKAALTDKILTEAEIMQGADQTQLLYRHCIDETVGKLKAMYPDSDAKTLIDTVNQSCIYSQDRFNPYSSLLAAASMKNPMSEKQAVVLLENDYKKIGRDQASHEQRIQIFKNVGLIKK